MFFGIITTNASVCTVNTHTYCIFLPFKLPSITAECELKTCHSRQQKTQGLSLSMSPCETAYQWAIIV